MLFMGHLDVVPIAPGTEQNWDEKPFSGKVNGPFIYGRGAIDDKVISFFLLLASLE